MAKRPADSVAITRGRTNVFADLGYRPGDLPVTEDVAERLLRLPYFYELGIEDQARIVAAVRTFFEGPSR